MFDVGSYEGQGSTVLYSADGARLHADAVDEQVSNALSLLEDVAEDSPGTSLSAGIDTLPTTLRSPAVLGGLTDIAGHERITERLGVFPDDLFSHRSGT